MRWQLCVMLWIWTRWSVMARGVSVGMKGLISTGRGGFKVLHMALKGLKAWDTVCTEHTVFFLTHMHIYTRASLCLVSWSLVWDLDGGLSGPADVTQLPKAHLFLCLLGAFWPEWDLIFRGTVRASKSATCTVPVWLLRYDYHYWCYLAESENLIDPNRCTETLWQK